MISTLSYLPQSFLPKLLELASAMAYVESTRKDFPANHRDFVALHTLTDIRSVGCAAEKHAIPRNSIREIWNGSLMKS
jgi:hypothetical protein